MLLSIRASCWGSGVGGKHAPCNGSPGIGALGFALQTLNGLTEAVNGGQKKIYFA